MPDSTLAALPPLAPAQLADLFYAVRGNADGKLTVGDLLALAYEPPVLYNPSMEVCQRYAPNASVALSGTPAYITDRWACVTTGAGVTAYQNTGGVNTGFRRGLAVQRANGTAATGQNSVLQALETVDCIPLQGRTLSLRMAAWAGANFSAPGGTVTVNVYAGNGTDQSLNSLYSGTWTGQNVLLSTTIVPPTNGTYGYFNVGTFTFPTNASQLGIYLFYSTSGVAGASDFVTYANVDIRPFNAPIFAPRFPFAMELARCQRFYEKTYDQGVQPGTATLSNCRTGAAVSTQNCQGHQFQAVKRATPTVSLWSRNGSANLVSDATTGADVGTTVSANGIGHSGFHRLDNVAGSLIAGRIYEYHYAAAAEL